MTKDPSSRPVAAWRWHVGLALGFTALALAMTWPLGSPMARVVPDMDDAFFSIWRLSWVAHQLVHQPTALFDANIFYPARHTLAYSDAMLLVGLAGAPFLWAGVPPAVVHNGLLIAALASSAWAMAILAHRLTGDLAAAILAGVIFGFAPYRFAHIAHLELQWLLWMPLAMLALHALVERPRLAAGLALGACLAAQLLCSIYYGVFLALFAGLAWMALVVATGVRPGLLAATAAAAVPLALVAVPYLAPYAASRSAHGPRSASEVADYSATPADYLRVPGFNALRGRDDDGLALEERALYPGLAALGLAIVGLWRPRNRTPWVYAALALVAFDASLGVHGLTFRVLQVVAPPLGNLRAPARFAALGLVAFAGLAAFGVAAVRNPRARAGVAALAVALCVVEFWSRPLPLRDARLAPMAVDRWLAALPEDTVILELPVPRLQRLWFYEPWHQVRSIHHWRHLLNGYSGFLPTAYGNTLADLETFPDARSVARLGRLSVDYVIVRRSNFDDRTYARVTAALLATPGFGPPLVVGAGRDEAAVYPLLAAGS
ncbi:MAG: hypothetical protein ABIT71_26285 [Vicinamibacteraceae bacterium]